MDKIFEVTKTLSNMKNHDFSVADYKVCPEESVVVMEALERYLIFLKIHAYEEDK